MKTKINNFQNINTIDQFLNKLENNPELVDSLSEKRLDILIKYYTDITMKNEIRIAELKRKIKNN